MSADARAAELPRPIWPQEACAGALPESLERIREWQLQLAVWQRRLPVAISAWIDYGFVPKVGGCRFVLGPRQNATDALQKALAGSIDDTAIGAVRWRQDILSLIAWAWRIAPQSPALRVRVERIEDDGCRLFHVDKVALRLVCSYLGAGTQWLPENAFDRAGLGCGCNDHVRDWSALREIASGDVAVMKGAAFPGNAGRGLLHRSPPATPAQPRVLMAIDFA